MSKKIVIIGGVAGGATAAVRLRRLNEEAEIVIIEKGEYVSFANCGLPYYIGGVIQDRDDLFVATKELINSRYNITIKILCEAVEIDRDGKKVRVKNLETQEEFIEKYDELLISTGSTPIIPNIPGVNSKNVFTLWNIEDTDKVYNYISRNHPQNAVVVGGGFIGVEMAENLVKKGMSVTLVEMLDQIMTPFDKDMSKILENHMEEKGIKLIFSDGVSQISDNGKGLVLNSGKEIETDIIMLAIGVRPNSLLAVDSNLLTNKRGGVITDDFFVTTDENIYAIGDVVEVKNFNTGEKTMVPLAGPANRQGRMVASNILKQKEERYRGTQGTSVVKVFDLTAASTGLNEKQLAAMGKEYKKDYFVAIIHPFSHALYYPDAKPMTMKLIFDNKGKVLGAQCIGVEGIDKRIDVIATSINFGADIYDLQNLELSYAPPYSSAKDPVNMAAYVAANILEGLSDGVMEREIEKLLKNGFLLIDVRSQGEFLSGHIEGAVNIPLPEIRKKIDYFHKDRNYLLYCAVGLRGYISERILKQNGIKAANLLGGYKTYSQINV